MSEDKDEIPIEDLVGPLTPIIVTPKTVEVFVPHTWTMFDVLEWMEVRFGLDWVYDLPGKVVYLH